MGKPVNRGKWLGGEGVPSAKREQMYLRQCKKQDQGDPIEENALEDSKSLP